MPQLSLDCLTLTDTAPQDLVRAAGSAGFDRVSLWTAPPLFPRQGVTADNEAEVARALAETGVGAHAIEFFDMRSAEALEGYRPALDLGARLGGRVAIAINHSNPDRDHVAELLAQFALIAGEYGLGVNVEPIALGQTRTLAEAASLIGAAGADCGITLDFLHLYRTGGGAREIRAIDPGLIRYVQVCDGKAQATAEEVVNEGVMRRLWPGAGDFPIDEYMAAVPPHALVGIECPDLARIQSGEVPEAIAAEAMRWLKRALPADQD